MGCSTLPPREEDGGDDSDDEEEDNENDQEDWEESGRASAPLRRCNAVTRSSSSAARAASKDGKDGKESAKDGSPNKPTTTNVRTLRSATADAEADDAARAAARARAEAEAAAAIRRRPKKVERPVGIALVAAVSAINNAYREADLATTKAREAQALAERALELAEAFAAGDRIPQAHFLAKESKTWPFLPEDVMPPVESSSSSSAQATPAAKRKLGASHWAKVANAKRAPMAMPSLAPPPPSPQLACSQLLTALPDLDTLEEAQTGSSSSTAQAKPRAATQAKQKPKPRGRPPRLLAGQGDENSPAWKVHLESTLAAVWQDVASSGMGKPTSIAEVEDIELRRRWMSRAREVARRTFSPSNGKQEKAEPLRPSLKTPDASVERLPDAALRRQDGSHSPGPDCQRRLTLKRRPSLDPGQEIVARVEESSETGAKRRRPNEHVADSPQDDPEAQHVFDGSQDRRAQSA